MITRRTTSRGVVVVDDGSWPAAVAAGIPTADSVDAAISRISDAVELAEAARQSAADLLAIAQGIPVSGDAVVPPSGAGPSTIPFRDSSNLFGWKDAADVVGSVVGWRVVTGLDTTGVVSASALIQAAVNAAAALGFGIILPPGRLKLTATVDMPSGAVVRSLGSTTVDLSAMGTAPGFQGIGSSAAAIRLGADAAEGSRSVTLVDASTVAPGDFVRLSATTVATTVTNQPIGEILRVRSVSGNVVTFSDYVLSRTYLTSATATLEVLTQKNGIRVEGIRFEGNPTATTTRFQAVRFDTCRNVSVRDCSFRWVHYVSVGLVDTIFARVAGCHFQDALETGSAYGVAVHWSSQDVTVTGCTSLRVRHQVTCGGGTSRKGTPRRVTVQGCTATESIDAGFDAHSGCEDFVVIGCSVIGGGQDGIIGQGRGFVVSGCRVQGVVRHGIYHQGTSSGGVECSITGNVVTRCGGRGILVTADGGVPLHQSWNGCSVTGNVVTDAGNTGIEIQQLAAGVWAEGATITGNTVNRVAAYGILVRGFRDATVTANYIAGVLATFMAIYLLSSPDGVVSANTINGGGVAQGIRLGASSTDVAITGNRVRACTTGVVTDASSSSTMVLGNIARSCTTPYSLVGSNATAGNL